MASNEPFFLVFVPSSIQFPNWIGLTCVTRILWKWSGVTSRTKSYEALWLLLALSQIAHSDGSQLSCAGDCNSPTERSLGWQTKVSYNLSATSMSHIGTGSSSLSQICRRLQPPPTPWLQPREIPTQLSCSPAPDTQTLHEIIMFGMTLSF